MEDNQYENLFLKNDKEKKDDDLEKIENTIDNENRKIFALLLGLPINTSLKKLREIYKNHETKI